MMTISGGHCPGSLHAKFGEAGVGGAADGGFPRPPDRGQGGVHLQRTHDRYADCEAGSECARYLRRDLILEVYLQKICIFQISV